VDRKRATPRSIWTGSISFGLVNVPVRLYPAVQEHKLHFHLVHEKDNSPIGYQKICKAENKPVRDDEVVKAFEYRKGEYVFMSDEDFEGAQAEGYKSIDVTDFVPQEEIDPIFFAKTYFLGPNEGAERVYSLLARALEEAELVAIAKFVMREQQHVGALRVREDVLTLEQLYFADEIRSTAEIKPPKQRVSKEELALARQLIESSTTRWKPQKYRDTYKEALTKAIAAKRKGKELHRAAEVEEEQPLDLLEALRASIKRGARGGASRLEPSSARGLESLPKSELEQRARRACIEGRSRMSKDELVHALERAA
jgi:DNA end-binding protein Ku